MAVCVPACFDRIIILLKVYCDEVDHYFVCLLFCLLSLAEITLVVVTIPKYYFTVIVLYLSIKEINWHSFSIITFP